MVWKYNTQKIKGIHNAFDNEIAVVFVHGNSLSLESFKHQIDDSRFSNVDIVGFDFLGHGLSDQSNNPKSDYTFNGMVSQLVHVVNSLDNNRVILVGHSLGGHICIQSLPFLFKKIAGFVLFGTPPAAIPAELDKMFFPNPLMPLIYKEHLLDEELNALAFAFANNDENIAQFLVSNLVQTHGYFRQCFAEDLAKNGIPDEIAILQKHEEIPLCFIHGESDCFINHSYLEGLSLNNIWGNKIHVIEKVGHVPQIEAKEAFNDLLFSFINDIDVL